MGRVQVIAGVTAAARAAADTAAEAVVKHLLQRLAGIFAEARVEEAVYERVDGVVDEKRLHAELVGDLADWAESSFKVLNGAAQNHHHEVRKKTQDVGQGHSKQHGGGFPDSDLRLFVRLHHFWLRFLCLGASFAASSSGESSSGQNGRVVVVLMATASCLGFRRQLSTGLIGLLWTKQKHKIKSV